MERVTRKIPVVVFAAFSCFLGLAQTRYVSPRGDDGNDGVTQENAFATVDRALQAGASDIVCLPGIYCQRVDLSLSTQSRITLRKLGTEGRVIFKNPDHILLDSGRERRVTGRVHRFKVGPGVVFDDSNNRIYQEGVPDRHSRILPDERHPLQGGADYRCQSTIIYRCVAEDRAAAIKEMNSCGDTCRWYFDAEKGTVYFSRPESSSSRTPICFSDGKPFFEGADGTTTVSMYGIEVWYMSVNVADMDHPLLVDCASRYVYGMGAFAWNCSSEATFVRCEAESCANGPVGDGFNAHATEDRPASAVLIGCWSHDNNDDGFSDHENCSSIIRGGLFEYNGTGVTPAYGARNVSIGVMARRNFCGFVSAGRASADGEAAGSITCYDCVAMHNTRKARDHYKFPSQKPRWCDFGVYGEGHTGTFINCRAEGTPLDFNAVPGGIMVVR